MTDLIELIFEDVPSELLDSFARVLMEKSIVLSLQASEMDGFTVENWKGNAYEVLTTNPSPSAAISLSLDRIIRPSLSLSRPMLQIIRYENLFDVNIIFAKEDLSLNTNDDEIAILHSDAMGLLEISGSKTSYCGYEPASDRSTRFFTDGKAGPLFTFWN